MKYCIFFMLTLIFAKNKIDILTNNALIKSDIQTAQIHTLWSNAMHPILCKKIYV